MRTIILMVSLLLISSAAEAGQMRGLTLASNAPAADQTEQSAPAQQPQPVRTETRAAKADVKTEQACGTGERPHDDGRDHDRRPARHHESAEHKARRIAARYGIYW